MNVRAFVLRGTAMIALGIAASPVHAQQETATKPAPAEDSIEFMEEMVVTGTRIGALNDTSTQPVSAITGDEIDARGLITVSDALNELPQFGSSFGSQNQDINSANAGFNIGTELINLRNLGPQRTLVLVNGRRHVAGDPGTSAVDLNSIPAGLIDRIDVVTGANSAVYGADAVSGVVNIILKENFEGTEAKIRCGLSSEGDAGEISGGVTIGLPITDRVRFLGGVEFSRRNPIFGRDRSWVEGDGATNTFGFSIGSAAVESGPFTTNVGAFVITPNGTIPWTTTSVGPEFRYQRVFDRNLQTESDRVVASGKVDFEATEDIRLFIESSYAQTKSEIQFEPQFFFFRSINAAQFDLPPVPQTNPFLAGFLSSVGATNLIQGTGTTRRLVQYGSRFAKVDRDLYRTAVGINGMLGRFDYEAYYQYGRVEARQEDGPSIDRNRIAAALNNCAVGDGVYGLRGVNYAALGCTPFNPFGVNNLSQQFIDYTLIDDVTSRTINQQHVVSGFVSGDLFPIFDSNLKGVLGGEYRSESTSSDVHPSLRDRSNAIRQINSTQGETEVAEVFGELALPLLDDRLKFGAAGRYSNYDTVGGQTTWNVNGSYQAFSFFRLRSSYGLAIRAPNVNELFSAISDSTGTLRDPCANDFNNDGVADPGIIAPAECRSQLGASFVITEDPAQGSVLRFRRGGNPELQPEDSNTFTVGGVFSFPEYFGLNFSADYYRIRLTDVVGSLVPSVVVNQCFTGGITSLCPLITRSSNRQLEAVSTQLFNIAQEQVSGMDLQARIEVPVGSGSIGANINYARLFSRTRTEFSGGPVADINGRIDALRDQSNSTVWYSLDRFVVSYSSRILGRALRGTSPANLADPNNVVPRYWYHDIQVSAEITDEIAFDFGIKNAGDKDPPIVTEFSNTGLVGSGGVTAGGIYDVRGRFFYINARAKF